LFERVSKPEFHTTTYVEHDDFWCFVEDNLNDWVPAEYHQYLPLVDYTDYYDNWCFNWGNDRISPFFFETAFTLEETLTSFDALAEKCTEAHKWKYTDSMRIITCIVWYVTEELYKVFGRQLNVRFCW
jgi:hypothetical protein